MKQEAPILDPHDFASIELTVTFKNLTSGTHWTVAGQATLQEIASDSLVLGLPKNSCAMGHSVELVISWTSPSEEAARDCLISGKVILLEGTDDPAVLRTEIEMIRYDRNAWQDLLTLRGTRQEAITAFLQAARG